MNEPDVIHKIKREKLDERNYFKTLIEEAYKNKMISENEITNIQIELIELLNERVYKYNGNASSSIKKEIMEVINCSNYYTIGLELKRFENPDEAIEIIKNKNLKDIYYRGKKRIDRSLDIINVMYIKIKQNKLNTQNTTYNCTITGGIQGFLKIYNPDFEAQNMKITADYPLYNNLIGKLEGVEFIKEYVNSIYIENEFCQNFENEKIENLLYAYSEKYKDLIINIFEIVLLDAIACKLVQKDIFNLKISSSDLSYIYGLLRGRKKEEVREIIENALQEICNELLKNKRQIQSYIEKNLDYIVTLIRSNVKQNTLDKVFVVQRIIEI